ncbi:WD40-repeat-containing domain protein [Scenedesmus sp. NREL 46B-D3]|nr:WD40-repeat-containing domain protein [Scenedesmus sp. NREL 46B-D3]
MWPSAHSGSKLTACCAACTASKLQARASHGAAAALAKRKRAIRGHSRCRTCLGSLATAFDCAVSGHMMPLQAYVESFDQLVAWADSSLDLYRVELQRVLYPVFVHVYLQLVQYGASHTAADLLKQYRRRLVEVGGRQSSMRAQELNELQAVAVAQHLDAHPFAKAARSSRSTLALSSYSFELLMHYLQGQKQWLLLSILNSHVRFELHEGQPLLGAAAAGDDEGAGLLQGQAGHEVGSINATPLDLGLLRDGEEDSYATQKLQCACVLAGECSVVLTAAREEEERLAEQSAAGASAAAAAAAEDGFTEAFGDDMDEGGGAPQSAAAQQASAAAKRLRAVRDRALAAAKAKQKDILERRRMPMQAHRGEGGDGLDVDGEEAELLEELEDWSNQQTMCLVGHSGTVNALSFSADQQLLFSASTDSTVRLWSTELRKGLAAYRRVCASSTTLAGATCSRGHVYPVWDVAACPHGSYLVSGGSDRTARLWSTEHARPLRIYAGHQSDVDAVAWHPNSQYVATGSSDRTLRLWDVGTGACVRLMSAQAGCPTCLAFSPDGRHLAAGTEDGSVAVYDLATARRMALLEGHQGPVWSAAYSRGSGSLLATGGADRTVRLYSMPHCDNILDAINEELAAAADPAAADAAAGAAGVRAGGASGASGSAAGVHHGGGVPQYQPYQLLRTFTTQATPVIHVSFSPRNLLLAGGPWTLASVSRQPRAGGR